MIMEPSPLPLRKPSRLRKAAPFIVASLVLVGLVVWVGGSAWVRAACGAYQIKGSSLLQLVLRRMHEQATHGATGLIDVPRLLLADPELLGVIDDHLTSFCAGQSEPRPTIGGVPIGNLVRDADLRAAIAAALPAPTEEWVHIGRMSIWQRAEAYTTYDAGLITGSESTSRFGWNVAYADGHVTFETDAESFLETDAPRRAELSQPPLPREWFVLPPRK